MAMANGQVRRRIWPRAVLVLLAIGGIALWWRHPVLNAYATTAAGFGARTACACHYQGGRPLDDCTRDFEPGMGLVFLSGDEEARSVTASVPFYASQTVTFTPPFGCVPERWQAPG
ncbi:hypothetical protein V5740_10440 [Croceibacterium sp. TMG7-5b_MA50]|uniref:hypothetical protein n=1 Tax=Croceibacterium sp. TMG7-5b_MA50 TaxID=3121290 RepID=UPI00322142A7